MTNKQKKAYIYAGITVFLWSTAGSAFKVTLRHITPLQMLWFAAFISVLVLFTILVIQKKTGLLRQQSLKDLGRSSVTGLLNPSATPSGQRRVPRRLCRHDANADVPKGLGRGQSGRLVGGKRTPHHRWPRGSHDWFF